MRTNIELDNDLVERLMASGEYKSKRALVHAALKELERQQILAYVRSQRGKFGPWDGQIEAGRMGELLK